MRDRGVSRLTRQAQPAPPRRRRPAVAAVAGYVLAWTGCGGEARPGEPTSPGLLPPEALPIAFVGVSVVPMDGKRVIEDRTVLVRGEIVEAVGSTDSVGVPDDVRVIDGTGLWLVPGLVDAHSHVGTNWSEFTNGPPADDDLQRMAEDQLLLYLANGVTTVLGNGDFGEPLPRWGAEVRTGRYPGPTVYAALWARGGPGTPDGGPPSRSVSDDADPAAHVQAGRRDGFDFVKLYNWTPAAAVAPLAAAARQSGMGVIGHLPQTVSTEQALEALDGVSHAESFLWSHFGHRVQPERVGDLLSLVRNADVHVITTLDMSTTTAAVWGGNEEGIAGFWGRPENRYMHWTEVGLHRESIEGPRWNPTGSRPGGLDARLDFVRSYTRSLFDAGVPLVAGTDAPSVFGVAGFSLHRELAELESLGIGREEVLATATRNAGDFIGAWTAGPPFGRVAPGYRADLLLLEANPLDDLANLRRRMAVMARGRLYREESLQEGLEAIARRVGGPSPMPRPADLRRR